MKKPGIAKNEAGSSHSTNGRVFSWIYRAPASGGKSARVRQLCQRTGRRCEQRGEPQHQEDDGRHHVHRADRHAPGDALTQPHHRRVGEHHAQRRARHHPEIGAVLGGQHDGGDLRLVAHLGEEERHHRGAEHAKARGASRLVVVQLVGNEHPHRHGDE